MAARLPRRCASGGGCGSCPHHEHVSEPRRGRRAPRPGAGLRHRHASDARRCAWSGSMRTSRRATRVIDYGCGSGVLALAAAKLGARAVHCFDIDPQALLATAENAAANGVAAAGAGARGGRDAAAPAPTCCSPTSSPGRCASWRRASQRCCAPGAWRCSPASCEHEAADVTAAYGAWFDVTPFGETRRLDLPRRATPLTHVHSLSEMRPDPGGDRRGPARRAGLRALRTLLERLQRSGAPRRRSLGRRRRCCSGERCPRSVGGRGRHRGRGRGRARGRGRGRPGRCGHRRRARPRTGCSGTQRSGTGRRGGADPGEDSLEFDPTRTDAASVFVEPPPDPQWTAATGSFKAMVAASPEKRRGRGGGDRLGVPRLDARARHRPAACRTAGRTAPGGRGRGTKTGARSASPGTGTAATRGIASAGAARSGPATHTRNTCRIAGSATARIRCAPRAQASDAAAWHAPQPPRGSRRPRRRRAAATPGAAAAPAPPATDAERATDLRAGLTRAATEADDEESTTELPARLRLEKLAWPAAVAVAALVLVVQVVDHYRDELAASTRFNRPLTALYAALGVHLVPHWDLRAYDVRQLGASDDAAGAGSITVRASIKNGAQQAQPLPLLRVTLQDRFGNRIASRDVEPRSLPAARHSGRLVPVGRSAHRCADGLRRSGRQRGGFRDRRLPAGRRRRDRLRQRHGHALKLRAVPCASVRTSCPRPSCSRPWRASPTGRSASCAAASARDWPPPR